MIELVLLGQPKGKGHAVRTRKGGVFMPGRTREYMDNLYAVAANYMIEYRLKPLAGPLVVNMVAYMAIPKSFSRKKREAALAGTLVPTTKPDRDNLEKMQDALNGVIWEDDAQIVLWSGRKTYSETPRLVVSIREFNTELDVEPDL